MESVVNIGTNSDLFYMALTEAAKIGILPQVETEHYDGAAFMRFWSVFTTALSETAQKENWPVKFQVST